VRLVRIRPPSYDKSKPGEDRISQLSSVEICRPPCYTDRGSTPEAPTTPVSCRPRIIEPTPDRSVMTRPDQLRVVNAAA
jgi:hypothetical protein